MSLKAVVDSLDGLRDEEKGLYVQGQDGKFRLDIEGGFKTESEIGGLTSALSKERARADAAEKEARERERVLRDREEELKKYTAGSPQPNDNVKSRPEEDARFKQMQEELARLRKENEERAAREEEQQKKLFLQESGVFSKAASESTRYWMRSELPKHVRFQDGKPVVVDENGSPLYDGYGVPLDPMKALEKLCEKNPDGKKGLVSDMNGNGSGAQPNSFASYAAKNPFAEKTFNKTEQYKLIKENPTLARSLAQSAGVAVTW